MLGNVKVLLCIPFPEMQKLTFCTVDCSQSMRKQMTMLIGYSVDSPISSFLYALLYFIFVENCFTCEL